ncbi:hypothetical protein OSTOST_08232, partial [Ostertagia ostertagi]
MVEAAANRKITLFSPNLSIRTLSSRCHRAGRYISGLSKETREMKQSKKQAKSCSCFLEVQLHDSGVVTATGCFGHVGHKLEVPLLLLSTKQELFLKNLLEKFSMDFILNRLQREYSPKTSRLGSIDRKDLWDLVRRYQILPVPRETGCPRNVMPSYGYRSCCGDDYEEEQDCDSEDDLLGRPSCSPPRPTQTSEKQKEPILLNVEGKRLHSATSLPSTSKEATKFSVKQIQRNHTNTENLLSMEKCEMPEGSFSEDNPLTTKNNRQKIFERFEEDVSRKIVHTIATVPPQDAPSLSCTVTSSGRAPMLASRSRSSLSTLQTTALLPKRLEAPHLMSPEGEHKPVPRPSCPPSQQSPVSEKQEDKKLILPKIEGESSLQRNEFALNFASG